MQLLMLKCPEGTAAEDSFALALHTAGRQYYEWVSMYGTVQFYNTL